MTGGVRLRYALGLWSYSWRWQRRHVVAWLATAMVLGVVLSMAAAVQLVVALCERSLDRQLRSASEMRVFLVDTARPDQQAVLRDKLVAVPGVQRVGYRSKSDAMARASRDPVLAPLAQASEGNPFPASFELQMRDPGVARTVLSAVAADPAVDPQVPASYTAAQAQQLSRALAAAKLAAGAVDAVAVGVVVVVALALLRSEVRARRDELRILTLVGVPGAAIRAPLAIQALSLALAGSALAAGSLLLMDQHVVPAIGQALPFLQLVDPGPAVRVLSVATVAATSSALIPCALLVKLPR